MHQSSPQQHTHTLHLDKSESTSLFTILVRYDHHNAHHSKCKNDDWNALIEACFAGPSSRPLRGTLRFGAWNAALERRKGGVVVACGWGCYLARSNWARARGSGVGAAESRGGAFQSEISASEGWRSLMLDVAFACPNQVHGILACGL
jgi:hypothetical protein